MVALGTSSKEISQGKERTERGVGGVTPIYSSRNG